MSSELRRQAYQVLDQALQLDVSERRAFLARACGAHRQLQGAVEDLLASGEAAEDFLEESVLADRSFPLIGQTLHHYEILTGIASGGMGEVYVARDHRLGRKVALKVLPEAMATDEERLGRFEREARVLASVNHPNIITIYSVEEARGLRFFTMELVEGISLAKLIPPRGMPTERFFELALPLVDALSSAHQLGIIHRDVKPANILVDREGRLKVLDFGLAKQQPLSPPLSGDTPATPLTQEGHVLGTMPYMSPEQAQGRGIDHRSDLFSLGIVFYRMITGRKPFTGENPASVLSSIVRDTPEPILALSPQVPPGLAEVIQHCLEKDRDRRFSSAQELRQRLEELRDDPWPRGPAADSHPGSPLLIGRQTELSQLGDCLESSLTAGERQVVFVTGEAGIGKTALVEAFLAEAKGTEKLCIAHGQCQELYGAGEAYMPVLEALDRVCRNGGGERLIALLDRYAPSWLAQMPGLITEAEMAATRSRADESTPEQFRTPERISRTTERMLREIAVALEALTAEVPLILVLEDLHWSDYSTLDLVSLLARRREPARLLLIASFRPTDVLAGSHPLKGMEHELRRRGLSMELPLDGLSLRSVEESLARRLGAEDLAPEMAELIYRMTDGNPLFLFSMIDHLLDRGHLEEADGEWRLKPGVGKQEMGVPDSLDRMIQAQVEALDQRDQQLLEVASAAGVEFSAAIAATGVEMEASDAEERYERLARRGHFLRPSGEEEWPDGTVTERYCFIHTLYQKALYQRLTAPQRVRMHRRIGERLEASYGPRVTEIAAALAVHFESGRAYRRAVKYYALAAQKARRRMAIREATEHLRKGLELLKKLPSGAQRDRQELEVRTALGAALSSRYGYAAPEVEQAYARVEELCRAMPESEPALPGALWGLWSFYLYRPNFGKALDFGHQLAHLARRPDDNTLAISAPTALGVTQFMLGQHEAALQHLTQATDLDSDDRRSFRALLTVDAGVTPRSAVVHSLWHLGYPDQALRSSDELLALAKEVSHPYSLAFALVWISWLHQLRGEIQQTRARAEEIIAVSEEHGLFFWTLGNVLLGWAQAAESGRPHERYRRGEEGLERLRRGLEGYRAPGTRIGQTYFLWLFAKTNAQQGHVEEAQSILQEALAEVEATGERFWAPELLRMRGELRWDDGEGPGREEETETFFRQALDLARRQSSKSLELRAATSLARLWQSQGEQARARALLAPVFGCFQEGFETADLKAARMLLDELEGLDRV